MEKVSNANLHLTDESTTEDNHLMKLIGEASKCKDLKRQRRLVGNIRNYCNEQLKSLNLKNQNNGKTAINPVL